MDASSYNRADYQQRRQRLNVVLEGIRRDGGLAAALDALIAQQSDAGFIQDDLDAVRRFRIRHAVDRSRSFSVQFNPRRALRHSGAGRTSPPPGTIPVNGGCFLCDENVAWQQRGLELGFDVTQGGVSYCCFANPFPLMPGHLTVATRDHVRQGWSADGGDALTLTALLTHLLTFAEQLPGFIVFFNGPDAGASIPGHFHFQMFRRPPVHAAFPLERCPRADDGASPTLVDYPLTVASFGDTVDDIIAQAPPWLRTWARRVGSEAAMSANFIATQTEGQLRLFVAPRHRSYSHAPGFAGLVGGLEILGEFVLTTEQERQSLETGDFTYERAFSVLAAVEPPEALRR